MPKPRLRWHRGPPPVKADGSLALVLLRPTQLNEDIPGHDGRPIVVERHCNRLRTTVLPISFAYDLVAWWAEYPACSFTNYKRNKYTLSPYSMKGQKQ